MEPTWLSEWVVELIGGGGVSVFAQKCTTKHSRHGKASGTRLTGGVSSLQNRI